MAKRFNIYYVNVGESSTRSWTDMRKFNFISAGQAEKYSKPLKSLNIDDIVCMYLKGAGYVGIGKVVQKALPILDFKTNDCNELDQNLLANPRLFDNSDNELLCEWLVGVEWIKDVDPEDAKWKSKTADGIKIYSTPLIKASMQNQQDTIDFLNNEFEIDIRELAGIKSEEITTEDTCNASNSDLDVITIDINLSDEEILNSIEEQLDEKFDYEYDDDYHDMKEATTWNTLEHFPDAKELFEESACTTLDELDNYETEDVTPEVKKLVYIEWAKQINIYYKNK